VPSFAKNATSQRLYAAFEQAENDLLFTAAAQSLTAETGTDGFGFENIVGVGVSERLAGGRPAGEGAVSIYVVRKAPLDEVDPSALVPTEYEGVPTDVVESGEFVIATERGRHRPVPLGVSVGHANGDTGTVGFLGKRDSELVIVSNNHVLARENRAGRGDAILQPGPVDGGGAGDQVGELEGWVALDFGGSKNPIDAAVARVDEAAVTGQLYGGGTIAPTLGKPSRNAIVRKCGRTSGLTRGVVTDVSATIKLRFPSGMALMSEQILIQGLGGSVFSEPGDSGSLVVEEGSDLPLGLLCGGSSRFTLANQIDQVLTGLGVSFVP
jgi:hypothetical protein